MTSPFQILLAVAFLAPGCLLVGARFVACVRWTFNPIAPRRNV
jgi:hypothetical protein